MPAAPDNSIGDAPNFGGLCLQKFQRKRSDFGDIYPIFRDRPDFGGGSQILAALIISYEMCCEYLSA